MQVMLHPYLQTIYIIILVKTGLLLCYSFCSQSVIIGCFLWCGDCVLRSVLQSQVISLKWVWFIRRTSLKRWSVGLSVVMPSDLFLSLALSLVVPPSQSIRTVQSQRSWLRPWSRWQFFKKLTKVMGRDWRLSPNSTRLLPQVIAMNFLALAQKP